MGVQVCHDAPLRRASDDPSGASAGSPAPLTQTVSPYPPCPEATGAGGEVGYLASVESDRKSAGLGPKGRAALKNGRENSIRRKSRSRTPSFPKVRLRIEPGQRTCTLPGCRIDIAQGGTPPGGIGAKWSRTTPPGRRGSRSGRLGGRLMVPPHSPRPGRPLRGAAGAPPIVTGAWID